MEPSQLVDCEKVHPMLAVKDIAASAAYYVDNLGFTLAFASGDPPDFAGVNLGKVQIFLFAGTPNPMSCEVYFVVSDVDELYRAHTAKGLKMKEPLSDRPWGLREYVVEDLDGYGLRFGQHLMSTEPKLEIERVDVPVRLETRLAAALQDLAVRKRMTIGECLEETLLHTFEGVGPHTKGDLAYIKMLKVKHGIDYDSHASYRFVEKP